MELWEVLDDNGNATGEIVEKYDQKVFDRGFYHLGADVWIINSKNEILIQKRSPQKRNEPNVWAMTGGSVIKGEDSLQTIEREVKEELGINLDMKNIKLIKKYKTVNVWIDTYIVRKEINLEDIIMQEMEVCEVKWATFDEIEELFHSQQFMKNRWEYVHDFIQAIL